MFKKIDTKAVARHIKSYPAVFIPNHWGGWDVVFPNFSKQEAAGVNFKAARKEAVQLLTVALYDHLKEGATPPKPSDPNRLHPDEDEIPGTRVVMIEPDTEMLLRFLGLEKHRRKTAPTGEKYRP